MPFNSAIFKVMVILDLIGLPILIVLIIQR